MFVKVPCTRVFENTESTARQYALRERALALGWAEERIVVIDQDLGHSASSTADRLGFQRLVAQVGLRQVGLVKGLGSVSTRAQRKLLAPSPGNLCPHPDAFLWMKKGSMTQRFL